MKNLPPLLTRPATLAVAAILAIALILAATGNGSSTATPTTADAAPNGRTERASQPETSAPDPDDEGPQHEHDVEEADHDHVDVSASSGHASQADVVAHTAVMALVDPAQATHVAVASGDWSDAATWGGDLPASGSHVRIPAGITVTVDTMLDPEIETIGVDGTLRFATEVNTELKVDTLVTSPTGTFEVGTPERPIAVGVIASIVFADDGPIDRSWDPSLVSRGALLHGRTVVQGAEVTHRTTVTAFPRAGDTSIQVAGPLEGWDAGDEIVITGTAGPTSDERRVVAAVDGTTVRFTEPLARDHVPPAAGLDLYVANLTRNVRFSSENTDIERRGHFMVMHTLDAQVRGARFTDMGRTDKSRELEDIDFGEIEPGAVGWDGSFERLNGTNVRGRYTVHVHRGGADPRSTPAVIADSVVTGDPGWAFTNHSSHVDFLRNVAYDNAGAGFFTEAGDETGRWIDNIAIRTVMPTFTLDDEGAIDPDLRADRQDFGVDGDGYWLQGNRVDLIGNVAAGSSAHGIIWWSESLAEADLGKVAMVDVSTLPDPSLVPDRDEIQVWWAPLGEVRDNTSYGAVVGIRARYIHGASYLEDPNSPPTAYIDTLRPTIDGVTVWDVRDGVLMNYNERLILRNIRAIGTAEPFDHNYGQTAAVGVGMDLGNDATFGPGAIENVDLRNFEVGLITPRHGAWTIDNLTTAATTDVLVHSPTHSERSLDMTGLTFASLDGTDLAGQEAGRRHVVLAYDYAGDGDGVDPSTAEDEFDEYGASIGDRVTWDGRGLYSHADPNRPADATSDPNVVNGFVGEPAPVPTITHQPGAGAMGADDDDEEIEEEGFDEDDEQFDDEDLEEGADREEDDGDEDLDDEESEDRDEDGDDEDLDDEDVDDEDNPVTFEMGTVEDVIDSAVAQIRGLLAGADQDELDELAEWCAEGFEADDQFVLACAGLGDGPTEATEAQGDVYDSIDQIVEAAADRIAELLADDDADIECDDEVDATDPAAFVCAILHGDADDE